ncbi:MAG: endonuclease/exonuclease/phosphatase [Desulfobacter sp.]|nr:endonuclease/exonuclease/phosphatase [Desulfobacter sp.]
MPKINLGWWNLENLFEHETASRDTALKSKLKSELKGWTAAIRDKKIAQLAKIIQMMFNGRGPALLGLCKAENESVVQRLANAVNLPARDYAVVSHESHDARGIDTSFILDLNELTVLSTHHQVVIKRSATRDIFWTRLRVNATGATFVAIANHWPARSAGQYLSEPFRILTGETHAYIVSCLLNKKRGGDPNLPLVSMGDFNDEPFNRSLQEYTLGTRDPGRVRHSKSGHLLNLMWPLMQGHDPGTYAYGSDWNMLDQFLVSKEMTKPGSPVRANHESLEIFKPAILKTKGGKPRKFSRPSAKRGADLEGFSDHFPITVELDV